VDANILLRIQLGGPYQQELDALWQQWLEQDARLIAPPLYSFEITSVVWQNVYQKHLNVDRGREIYQHIFSQDVQVEYPLDLHDRAWEIAQQFQLAQAYDAHYVALAQAFDCEFWTMDRRLYNLLHEKLSWVRSVPETSDEERP
jgi:predicted nucleic acid-binding protein